MTILNINYDTESEMVFMRIVNTRRITEKIMQLLEMKPVSSMVNSIIASMIKENSVIPSDIEQLRTEASKLINEMKSSGQTPYSEDKVMLLLMVESMIAPYLNERPDILNFYMNAIFAESKVFDVDEFNNNPYIRNIDFSEKHQGDYELLYHKFMPYEVDIYSPPKRLEKVHIDVPRISCFTQTFQ